MVILALITAPDSVAKILTYLKLPAAPPAIAPASCIEEQVEFAYEDELSESEVDEPTTAQIDQARAPP